MRRSTTTIVHNKYPRTNFHIPKRPRFHGDGGAGGGGRGAGGKQTQSAHWHLPAALNRRNRQARIKNLEGNGLHLKVARIGVAKGEIFNGKTFDLGYFKADHF